MIRAADLFCGAGGASTGLLQAAAAAGVRVDLTAINHWPVAVETHAANHPEARHLCESLDSVDPRKTVGGRLDVLWASPECTHHSLARGGKPMQDQSRATAWHVVRWAEALRPHWIGVENVMEFAEWAPLGLNGKPLKSRKGETFRAWFNAVCSLGYAGEVRKLCAANYGAATTRTRLFVVFRYDGGRRRGPIAWPDETHTERPDLFVRAKWRAAREVIDWSLPSRSIFGRPKPLADNTLKRIAAGARKFWGVELEPFLMAFYGAKRPGDARATSLDAPLPTIPTNNRFALVSPLVLGQQSGAAARPVGEPMPTIATDGAIRLIEPFLVKYYGSGENVESVREPLSTITTRDRFGVVSGEATSAALDILIRMLAPHELSAGMGFPQGYRFAGNREAQVRQIGNAVEVHQAEALCRAMLRAHLERAA